MWSDRCCFSCLLTTDQNGESAWPHSLSTAWGTTRIKWTLSTTSMMGISGNFTEIEPLTFKRDVNGSRSIGLFDTAIHRKLYVGGGKELTDIDIQHWHFHSVHWLQSAQHNTIHAHALHSQYSISQLLVILTYIPNGIYSIIRRNIHRQWVSDRNPVAHPRRLWGKIP